MRKKFTGLLALVLAFGLFAGCSVKLTMQDGTPDLQIQNPEGFLEDGNIRLQLGQQGPRLEFNIADLFPDVKPDNADSPVHVPAYHGDPYITVNDNIPFFTEEEITDHSFEFYSPLDSLGRCGAAIASIGEDLMPTEKRESIQEVKPTGWRQHQYDWVDGKSLYNRCHLIGFQLAGENANEKNLITGTRSFNIHGMLPFENMVADFVKETGNHVMYRVTPIFSGENLVASGVLMEALSVEDRGEGITFCIFAYNAEPGVTIDYATGENWAEGLSAESSSRNESYILNTGSKKFHLPSCDGVKKMNRKNRRIFEGSRDELIKKGYSPCGICSP